MRRCFMVFAVAGLAGCAGTGDMLTSRKFRKDPFNTLFKSEDPLTTMTTNPEGDERARAMRRLKEPAANGRPEDQDKAVEVLSAAATSDPSPVVRVAAVDALGRFRDDRAVGILTAAYHSAPGGAPKLTGRGQNDPALMPLLGPSGFPPEHVVMIRSRVADALAGTGRPEAVPVLAKMANGAAEGDDAVDRDVRLAAVRGLAKLRVPDSAVALSKVLAAEKGKDPALAGRAHDGLITLTGHSMPADPEQWNSFLRTNPQIAPEPNAVQRAVGWVSDY